MSRCYTPGSKVASRDILFIGRQALTQGFLQCSRREVLLLLQLPAGLREGLGELQFEGHHLARIAAQGCGEDGLILIEQGISFWLSTSFDFSDFKMAVRGIRRWSSGRSSQVSQGFQIRSAQSCETRGQGFLVSSSLLTA